jgi:hypothetical protein
MIRLCIATTLGAAVAAVVAWQLGGTLGSGVLAGYLLGAGLSGLGSLYQRQVLLVRPADSLRAFALAFGAKLVAVLLGSLAFRFVEPCARRADWRSFLVAFAFAVVVVLPFGTLDATRALRKKSLGQGGAA